MSGYIQVMSKSQRKFYAYDVLGKNVKQKKQNAFINTLYLKELNVQILTIGKNVFVGKNLSVKMLNLLRHPLVFSTDVITIYSLETLFLILMIIYGLFFLKATTLQNKKKDEKTLKRTVFWLYILFRQYFLTVLAENTCYNNIFLPRNISLI